MVEIVGGLYHVLTRGNDRQTIFHSDDDHRPSRRLRSENCLEITGINSSNVSRRYDPGGEPNACRKVISTTQPTESSKRTNRSKVQADSQVLGSETPAVLRSKQVGNSAHIIKDWDRSLLVSDQSTM